MQLVNGMRKLTAAAVFVAGASLAQSALAQVPNVGSQWVELSRPATDDARYAVIKPVVLPTATISVEWDLNYKVSNLGNTAFGPYFAVEANDALDNANNFVLVAGSAGVDANTKEFLYQAAGTGFLTPVADATNAETGTVQLLPGVWNHFKMDLNYGTKQYSVFLNNSATPIVTSGFVDGANDFTDADLAALAAGGDPLSLNATGTALFDNYKVTGPSGVIYDSSGFESPKFSLGALAGQDSANGTWLDDPQGVGTGNVVPEPSSLAVLGLAGMGLMGRVRRKKA